MRGTRLEVMRDHVRAIHRTVTGGDPPESQPPDNAAAPTPMPTIDQVMRRFSELEALARATPLVAERVAPFSFAPPLDVIGTERELILELAVPSVDGADVDVEIVDGNLIISGARSTRPAADERVYLHAELPRGLFTRIVRLPEPVSGAPRIEVDNGIVRIRLAKTSKSPLPRA